MAYADEQSYEEMINALQNFMSQTQEQCEVMTRAGADCVDNTDHDPAAVKGNERLGECVQSITATFEIIQNVIAALQDELERIREAAQKADSI